MNSFSFKADEDTIKQIEADYASFKVNSDNEYIRSFFKTNKCTISIYTSNKVVLQGQEINEIANKYIQKKIIDEAGSDEVGTGDYFGPVCVCACIVKSELVKQLPIGINDSKQINDTNIKVLAKQIMKQIPYSLLILSPKQYNEVHQNNNMNQIKAKMHNKAYLNLIDKGYNLPSATYVDQFTPEENYYRYLINEERVYRPLIFETKAESNHISVACASIIARYAFIEYMNKMNENYKFNFHLGASDLVDEDGYKFVKKYGYDKLKEVAKLHFKNSEKIKEMLESEK